MVYYIDADVPLCDHVATVHIFVRIVASSERWLLLLPYFANTTLTSRLHYLGSNHLELKGAGTHMHRFSIASHAGAVMYAHAGSHPCALRLPFLSGRVLINHTVLRMFVGASHVPIITGAFVRGLQSR